MKEKVGLLTEELEKTKADNVKLYGKIRYVQDYNHEKIVSRGPKRVSFIIFLLISFNDYCLCLFLPYFKIIWSYINICIIYIYSVCRRYWEWFQFRCWIQVQEDIWGWYKSFCCFLKEGTELFLPLVMYATCCCCCCCVLLFIFLFIFYAFLTWFVMFTPENQWGKKSL